MNVYTLNQIPSETQIKKFLRKTVFGSHIYCPECHSRNVTSETQRYWCRKCRTRFSLTSHTWLSHCKLPLEQFWMVLWCWTAQIPIRQTICLTKLSEVTIRKWFETFRLQLPEDETILDHLVQLDEAYFGGKHGRTLFMAKEVGGRRLAYQLLQHPHPKREHAWWFIQTYIKPNSALFTDGASIYKEIDQWWPVYHTQDLHKKFEFEQTSEIEGMFGVLRTFIRRMYHHVTLDKLPPLVAEFSYRFSHPEMFENPRYFLQITLHPATTR
jgi:transposase-like protein